MIVTIKKIYIKNCLSIKEAELDLASLNCFIGENGVGKSTLYKVMDYFYSALGNEKSSCELHDKHNPFNDNLIIKVTFDFNFFNKMLKNVFSESPFYTKLRELRDISEDNELAITLIHNKKSGKITWGNKLTHKLRVFIRGIYPFYFINSRNINLHDWSQLWEMVAELSIFPEEKEELNNVLSESQGIKYGEFLKIINNTINENNFKIDSYSIKKQFLSILKLRLRGEEISYKYNTLNYYSDGLNSFNFIKMFLQLVMRISHYRKTKFPTVFIDEPEIGLHPKFLDKLVDSLDHNSNTAVCVNTHSSRLVKNIISNKYDYLIYHLSITNNYTAFNKMIKPNDSRELKKISEKEASFYFSSGLVLVEGLTELQLFNNNNLQALFPFLKDIDFYSFDGDDNINLEIVHPNKKNINIPYLIIVDADKLFYIRNKKIIFRGNKNTNPLKNEELHKKEKYFFGEKRLRTYNLRKRICGIENNYQFIQTKYWFTLPSSFYNDTINLIKEYCINYNLYPVKTTIEGVLVTDENCDTFAEWLNFTKKISRSDLDSIMNYSNDRKTRSTFFRKIVNGKYDSLTTDDHFNNTIEPTLPIKEKSIYKLIKNHKLINKTSWVEDWLNYYFEHEINNKSKNIRILKFRSTFPELYDIIKTIEEKTIKE
jgi:predicted ATPase